MMGGVRDVITFGLVLAHVGVSGLWLGAMSYSLFVAQPRLAKLVGDDPEKIEDIHRELANGNRWRVAAMIAVIWLSGGALVALHFGEQGLGDWVLLTIKAVLLAAASALFWWVSWRGWPMRVFALPEELPALQARFRKVAVTMFALVASGFVLGVATSAF
jgi:hypothetical protein